MKALEKLLDELIEENRVRNIFVRVGKGDKILYDTHRGGVDENTLFDMASVTKVLATTSLALIALDKCLLSLDDEVTKFFHDCEKKITILDMLTHTVGIGHKSLNKKGNDYQSIASYIYDIPSDYEIGKTVIYSCPGFILLGKTLEKVYGKPLNEAFLDLVAKPLSLERTGFLISERERAVNSNLKEEDRGLVNDYNCRFLGGVAGNAGVFSTANDLTKFVKCLLSHGNPLFSEQTFKLATKNYTADKAFAGDERANRALGFVFVDENYAQTGGLFTAGSIGHCGHTGQSVFVDINTGLFVIVLSDLTLCSQILHGGYENYEEVKEIRKKIHEVIKEDIR